MKNHVYKLVITLKKKMVEIKLIGDIVQIFMTSRWR